MKRFDLHVHSEHSKDAQGSVLALAQAAARAGLDGFALTDHDTVGGHKEIQAAQEATGVVIVPGVEVGCAEGHVLVLGVDRAPTRGASLEDVVRDADAAGGIAIPSHPLRAMTGIGPGALAAAASRLVACEAINARERRVVQHNTAATVARHRLAAVGGSDAHWIEDIGTAWTSVPDDVVDAASLIAALKAGRCEAAGASLPRRSIWAHRLRLAKSFVTKR